MSVATIQAEVLSLPPGERAKLIDVLWDSLASPEVTSREAAWAEESERRIDAVEAGTLRARDAGTVFSDLHRTCGNECAIHYLRGSGAPGSDRGLALAAVYSTVEAGMRKV
jgi:putative addiction module component (TIGR02574 family)